MIFIYSAAMIIANWLNFLASFGHIWSPEWISVGLLLWCYFCITVFFLAFKIEGLMIYQIIALLIADIQVLCAAKFSFSNNLVPLGTVIYTTIFLVNDLITEHASAEVAKKTVNLVLCGHLFFFSLILWTLAYPPICAEQPHHQIFIASAEAISILFSPHLVIFLSSQCAYLVSQNIDISIFAQIKNKMPKALILRSLVSVLLAVFFDTCIFNLFAWQLFAQDAIPWKELWNDYICFNTMIQLIILFCNIPVFYGLTRTLPSINRLSRFFFFIHQNRASSSTNW